MPKTNPARPGAVTAVASMVWATGAINIVAGVLLLLQYGNDERAKQFGGIGVLLTFSAALTILGAVTVIVAGGLFGGSNGARVVVTTFQLLSIGAAIYVSLAAPWLLWLAAVSILISIVALVLLYAGKASAFFRR